MPRRRATPTQRLARQAAELSFAVPQVVGHRVLRMATAGLNPSARDRLEFAGMGSEKVLAFYQSWGAMWAQVFRAQMAMAQGLAAMAWTPWVVGARVGGVAAPSAAAVATKVLAAGLAPVHRKAVANAKRLGRRSG
jgi:hypothetical protein